MDRATYEKIKMISDRTGQPFDVVLAQLQVMGGAPADQTQSMMGETPTDTSAVPPETQEAPVTQTGMPSVDTDNTAPEGTSQKGGAGWTNAATLALANSMPSLINAAYQRRDPAKGVSVGGGRAAFKMDDPFKKNERFRSLMAQYLK
jgi:hypothetical protein